MLGGLMGRKDKLVQRVLSGASDANIVFADLCSLLRTLGFQERTRGSHHIYTKDGIEEILNIQAKGDKAKPYQVKQVRTIIVPYKLGGTEHG
jgi:predicted RNA binding protein YcfA (HicA-like mRNA interferase family)